MGMKSNSGLFQGTSGLHKQEATQTSKSSNITEYKVTEALKKHIEEADTSSLNQSGIKGGHNKDNFLKAANENGVKITKTESNSQMEGVEKIYYKVPKKDIQGKPTSELKATEYKKTVYDPKILSTDQYVNYGIEAANNAAKNSSTGKLSREWTGTDSNGVKWHGYCDESGQITSIYPED